MAYPTNQQCWTMATKLQPPPPGAIMVFAFAAMNGRLPGEGKTEAEGLREFNDWMTHLWPAAVATGVDPAVICGYEQQSGRYPALGDPYVRADFNAYLERIGVRDPATGNLINLGYRPGPGDGYLGNGAATDPGLGHAPLTQLIGQLAASIGGPQASADVTAGAQHAANDPLGFLSQHWLPVAAAGGALLLLGRRR